MVTSHRPFVTRGTDMTPPPSDHRARGIAVRQARAARGHPPLAATTQSTSTSSSSPSALTSSQS